MYLSFTGSTPPKMHVYLFCNLFICQFMYLISSSLWWHDVLARGWQVLYKHLFAAQTFYAAAEALHNSRRIRALWIKRRTRRFLALVKTCLAWPGPIAFCPYLQADLTTISTCKKTAWKFWKPVRLTGRFWKCERDRGRSRWGYVAGLHSKWFLKHWWWFGE